MAYIGIKNKKIVVYSDKPIQKDFYSLDEIKETKEKYMLSNDGTSYVPYKKEVIEKREIQQEIEHKEKEYQMNRWQREIILAENSGASDYIKQKAQEIESLANKIRA